VICEHLSPARSSLCVLMVGPTIPGHHQSFSLQWKGFFGCSGVGTHPTEHLADQLTFHQTQLTAKSGQLTRLAWSMLTVAVYGDLTSGKRNRLMKAVETTVFAKMNLEDLHRVTDSWLLWTLITVNAASNCYVYAVVIFNIYFIFVVPVT